MSESDARRLYGAVSLSLPLSWRVLGTFLFISATSVLVALSFGSFARVEAVKGRILLYKGLPGVALSRSGVIDAVFVSEGQKVKRGQRLLKVSSAETLATGGVPTEVTMQALRQQDDQLSAQKTMIGLAGEASVARIGSRIAGLDQEVLMIKGQISEQRSLISLAEEDYGVARELATKGFVSKRDLASRYTNLVTRRQQLSQLQQIAVSKEGDISQAKREIQETKATSRAQIANVQSLQAANIQQLTQSKLEGGYGITSPIDGTVTALTARVGQEVSSGQGLMMLIPDSSSSYAELYVPPSAVGFIQAGQSIRIAIDAYPYQTFGTVPAKVQSISLAPITQTTASGTVPMYLITARLPHNGIGIYGKDRPFMPGMTLTARIEVDRRSLFRWLFEPFYAVVKR